MQAMYVRLPSDAREAVCRYAERNWRDPRDQAALLIIEGLQRAGALPLEPDSGTPPPEAPR
jgi:hypothetical protein